MQLSFNTITETLNCLYTMQHNLNTSYRHISEFVSEDFKKSLQTEIDKFQVLEDNFYEDLDN